MWDLQEEGHVTSGRRVRRLARAAGLQCVHPGPSARTTVQDSKAIGGLVDLVDRQFTAPEPDQLWVGDITYIWTYSGFAYLAPGRVPSSLPAFLRCSGRMAMPLPSPCIMITSVSGWSSSSASRDRCS